VNKYVTDNVVAGGIVIDCCGPGAPNNKRKAHHIN